MNMRMRRDTRRSGFSLVLAGVGAILYFWLTDPRLGVHGRSSFDIIDAISEGRAGTYVGIGVAGVIAVIGLWLIMRRTA
jgi:hypothetical protein